MRMFVNVVNVVTVVLLNHKNRPGTKGNDEGEENLPDARWLSREAPPQSETEFQIKITTNQQVNTNHFKGLQRLSSVMSPSFYVMI